MNQVLEQALIVLSGIPIAFAIYGVITFAVKVRIAWASRKQAAAAGRA